MDEKSIVKIYEEWSAGTVIPLLLAKVVYQEETTGKYGPGVHNHITDGCGNALVITTWRTHMNDLIMGKYKIYEKFDLEFVILSSC